MTAYALVQNGVIARSPQPLPTDFAGILNFHLYPTPRDYGWLPVTYGTVPAYDPYTEKIVTVMTVSGNTVNVAYSKQGMTSAEIVEAFPVPQSVTAAQGMIELNNMGLLDGIEAVVAAADRNTQIWYTKAPNWDRNHPILVALAAQLGLTGAQVDDMFRAAAKL